MITFILWGVLATCVLLSALIFIFGKMNHLYAGVAETKASMKGKTIIITGSSAGIGKEAARDIARRGGRVILACRNMEKASKVAAEIRSSTGNQDIVVNKLDTSSLASVRSFAAEILSQETRIDVLVLNAGIGGPDELCLTPEGFEITMATNHFGHFLLANLLLGRLKESSPSRIVVTASTAHTHVKKLDVDNLDFKKGGYQPMNAYAISKLCNVLFSQRLAEITVGTGVVSNSLCPGLVATEIFDKCGGLLLGQIFRILAPFMGRTLEEGSQTIIHLAVAEETADITGKHFEECKIAKRLNVLTKDPGLSKKLWEVSESAVKLEEKDRHY